ncbi:MAG: hypothetical protein ICV72_10260 [Aldersonia sp.]|nr:hypothetical protein [Aldersonia sp.]
MSNPNDPWSQRGQNESRRDQSTEDFDAPTEHYHTADPRQAYGEHVPTEIYDGSAPTEAYPTYQYAPQGQPTQAYTERGYPPPTNPTMAYPTQQGQYGQYPGEIPPLEDEKRPKRTGLWIGLGVLVVLLALVVGAMALMSRDSTPTASDSRTTTRLQPPTAQLPPLRSPTQAPRPTDAPPPGIPTEPGLGGVMNDLGAAMGTITATDGSTLTLENTISGGTTTVRTDSQTAVVSTSGSKVSDLKVGESVVAQGESVGDGTLLAKVIVAMTLDLDGFGR